MLSQLLTYVKGNMRKEYALETLWEVRIEDSTYFQPFLYKPSDKKETQIVYLSFEQWDK